MSRLILEDWCDAPEALVRDLYRAEIIRWDSVLEWDTEANWAEVERGRRLRTVRGLLARNSTGMVVGWTFYIVHARSLQVGGFVSRSATCTDVLVDGMLSARVLAAVDSVTCFAFCNSDRLAPSLRRYGLAVGRYWYLTRDIPLDDGSMSSPREARVWRPSDADATADLLSRAYGPSDGSRPFAPSGTPDEWEQYVTQLMRSNGCGTLLGGASLCVQAGPGRLAAVALVSQISPGTGHLVQLAVDPTFQRRGLGSSLLHGVCGAAARAGCRRFTLLVDGRNTRARGLYEAAGFEAVGSFVSAGTLQPLRSTRVAFEASVTTFL